MSETSRSRVTITLGRTGQVVKRAGVELDYSFAGSRPVVGVKRSVRDRLGSNVNSTAEFDFNKRLKGEYTSDNDVDELHLSKDDLRFKIMRKNILKQNHGQQNAVDLRNLLSRPAQSSTNSLVTQQQITDMKDRRLDSERRDGRHHFLHRDGRELISSRQRLPEPREQRPGDPRGQHMPDPRGQRMPGPRGQPMPDPRGQRMPDPRERRMPEAREVRQCPPEVTNARYRIPEPSGLNIMGHMPSTSTANAVTRVDSVINSYSPWNIDRLRRKSPDEVMMSSRGLSPRRRDEELQRRLPARTYDDARTTAYMSKDVFDFSRPVSSTSYMTKAAPPAGHVKTMAPVVAPLPLSGSLVQKSSYAVDGHLTVDSFLQSLGLEKYAIYFKAEEVDMYALRQMSDDDLKALGIPMGPRKKIILSLLSRFKRQA